MSTMAKSPSSRDVQTGTGFRGTAVRLLLVAAVSGLVAGCGLGSFTSGLGGGLFGGSSKPNEDPLLAAARGQDTYTGTLGEVSSQCPRVVVPPRDNHVTIYEPGRAGDGLAVMHRGELTKTARECQINGTTVTVKYGFEGRVLLGPKGRPGVVSLPIKVALTDSKREMVKADNAVIETALTIENPIGGFKSIKTLTFQIPVGSRPGEYEIQLGFQSNIPGAG
ncbi:MAG: hypothetical protein AB7O57_18835 [Hyphomicrobiaceae bacterium]